MFGSKIMIAVLLLELIALALLCICSAFFSSSETAMFSLNSIQIHHIRMKRPSAAKKIENLLSHPSQLLSTILIGNTLVNVSTAGLGYTVAEHLVPNWGEFIAIPVITILLLIFGEVGPKRLAMRYPEKLASAYASTLSVLIQLFTPLRFILAKMTSFFQKDAAVPRRPLTEDEFMTVVEVGEEEGVLDEEERTMVDGIIGLEETQASDVMTPRVDLTGIDMDDPPEIREKIARNVRYRYLPVYTGSLDNIHGFLDVPRFILSGKHDIAKSMVSVYSVPETAPLDALLSTFQKENRRVAVVVDEYGGTAGLITRGDILEEIVDDVDTEFGVEKADIQKIGDKSWLVDGSTSLEEINYELDMNLFAEGADRIAGWVSAQVGYIPKIGEIIEAQGCRAVINHRRKNRITLILLEKIKHD